MFFCKHGFCFMNSDDGPGIKLVVIMAESFLHYTMIYLSMCE